MGCTQGARSWGVEIPADKDRSETNGEPTPPVPAGLHPPFSQVRAMHNRDECWSEKPEVDGSTPSLTTIHLAG